MTTLTRYAECIEQFEAHSSSIFCEFALCLSIFADLEEVRELEAAYTYIYSLDPDKAHWNNSFKARSPRMGILMIRHWRVGVGEYTSHRQREGQWPIPQLLDFKSQILANAAWAFATVGHKDECLFSTLAAAAERRMMDFNSQHLANAAWAFATVGHKDECLFSTLAAAAERRMMDFNSQNLANTAWAFATVGTRTQRWAQGQRGTVKL